MDMQLYFLAITAIFSYVSGDKIRLPSFKKLLLNYPGYKHFGGRYNHNRIISMIGCDRKLLLRDTSALRISYALNKVDGQHSIGRNPIHLSKYGKDSVSGRDGLQYLYHPIAIGPYFADKYGYPNISVLHKKDPYETKSKFWGKQGIMEIITYTKHGNKPKGHIALWDCDHIHHAKDWIAKHTLVSVEFWESPDTSCNMRIDSSSSTSLFSSSSSPYYKKSKFQISKNSKDFNDIKSNRNPNKRKLSYRKDYFKFNLLKKKKAYLTKLQNEVHIY